MDGRHAVGDEECTAVRQGTVAIDVADGSDRAAIGQGAKVGQLGTAAIVVQRAEVPEKTIAIVDDLAVFVVYRSVVCAGAGDQAQGVTIEA